MPDNQELVINITVETKDGLVKIPEFKCRGISIDPPFVRYHIVPDAETFDVHMNRIATVNMKKITKLILTPKLVPPMNIR